MDIVFKLYHFAYEFTARIETTIVDENYRRKGIGSKLIKKCEEKAKEMNCKLIELDSAISRENAHKFYEENGYEKRGFLFWKKI
jgi:GNAT superfamily N-acetyltransferase